MVNDEIQYTDKLDILTNHLGTNSVIVMSPGCTRLCKTKCLQVYIEILMALALILFWLCLDKLFTMDRHTDRGKDRRIWQTQGSSDWAYKCICGEYTCRA